MWGVPLLFLASPAELLMLGSAILLHEGGHLLGFFLTGEPAPGLSAALAGLTLDPTRPLPYRHELCVAAAGPLANLLAAIPLLLSGSDGYRMLGGVHLVTALSNLLPIGRCDGARVLGALLALLLPLRIAERLMAAISAITFSALLFFLLFLLLHEGGGGVILLLISLFLRAHPPS